MRIAYRWPAVPHIDVLKLFNIFELAYNKFFTKDAKETYLPPDLLLELKTLLAKEVVAFERLLIENNLKRGGENLVSRWGYGEDT